MSAPSTRLLLIGAGGHGRVVADAASASALWTEIAFVDDSVPQATVSGAWPVVGRVDDLRSLRERFACCVVAIGSSARRLELLEKARVAGFDVPTIVHPAACVSRHAALGAGTVVFAGAVVNIGARLGAGCIVNTGASVDHDCILGDGVHVCPGARLAGDVRVASGSWIGIGAAVRQGVRIGAGATVGAGAAVVSDVPDGVTVVGVPARILAPRAR